MFSHRPQYIDIVRPAKNVMCHPSWGCMVADDDPDYYVPAVEIDLGDNEPLYVMATLPEGIDTVTVRYVHCPRLFFDRDRYHPVLFDLGKGLEKGLLI